MSAAPGGISRDQDPPGPGHRPPAWFRDPAREFRTAAFWFWHRIPTDAEIAGQLLDMRDTGLGAVMIQARPALGLDAYLSDRYLAAYRTACAEARRLGLGITVYDEYGWMSGHGGGRTVRGADALRERHLFWTSAPAGPGGTVLAVTGIRAPFLDFLGEVGRAWLYEGAAARWGDWRGVLVVAHPETTADEAALRVVEGPVTIEPAGDDACRIAIPATAVPEGWTVTAFVSARCLTSRLVNYLLPEAATRFAEVVLAPLVEAAGGAAEGVFFDHPHAGFYVWDERRGPLGNSLLSDGTPAAPSEAAALLSLARDVGPRTAALRAGYLETYGRRMHEAFFGTLSRWAAAHGLGFTGHELLTHVGGWALHGGLTGFDPRTMPGVDYFGIDAYRTETTVDAADYAPQLAARLGDSVARANGRRRCQVEQYSTGREIGLPALAGQWGLAPGRFRAQAIRHILSGARRLVLHAVAVTDGHDGDDRLLANPRFDFPPAFNFEPWWPDCPAIFAEFARLSAFLEEGEPVRPVALLYPLETIRVEGPAHSCGEQFGMWAEALARAGIGYDVLDERTLPAELGPGTRYGALVLPAVTALSSPGSVEAMLGFAGRGGRLLASGPLPTGGRADPSGLGGLSGPDGLVHLPDPTPDRVAACLAALPRPVPDLRFADGGPTWCSVARCGDAWRAAVLNDGSDPRSLSVDLGGQAVEAAVWDPRTGEAIDRPAEVADGAGSSYLVGAQEVLCLTLRPGRPSLPPLVGPAPRPADGAAGLPPPRVLADGWSLEAGGRSPVPIAVDRGWERQGFPAFAGTGLYRRTVHLPATAPGLRWRLLLPQVHETAEVRVDGLVVGRHVAGVASFDLPSVPGGEDRAVAVEIHVRNTAGNRYYAGTAYMDGPPRPSGLTCPPRLVATAT